jgi:hypothetical protein
MNKLLEYRPEMEFLTPLSEGTAPLSGAVSQEVAQAARLLEVASEGELEAYLAALFDHAGSDGGRGARPVPAPLRRALVAGLRQAAHIALPLGRGALSGTVIAAMGRSGGAVLKERAARVFGLELEGLSPEDKEFELAQHFVHFAADAARQALDDAPQLAHATPASLPRLAHATAQAALAQAARSHAPGLLKRRAAGSGTWRRHGRHITLFGC